MVQQAKPRVAFITGISGQDGTYLCELLLKKGYQVHGLVRPRTTGHSNLFPLLRALREESPAENRLVLHDGDVLDTFSILRLLSTTPVDEIYHLAAQSHVGTSFGLQAYTANVIALGTLRILETILALGLEKQVKFYNACSSEVYGNSTEKTQCEDTPFRPVSPYAAAKAFAYHMTASVRDSHGLFAVNGILFNHESPRRGTNFVSRKITCGVAKISRGQMECLELGNLEARRDWGHAKDYMHGVWLMMQQRQPCDYVLATGRTRSVRELVETAFRLAGITIFWRGESISEEGIDADSGRVVVKLRHDLYRPNEVASLQGDASKASRELGWRPQRTFEDLVREMMQHDLAAIEGEQCPGYSPRGRTNGPPCKL